MGLFSRRPPEPMAPRAWAMHHDGDGPAGDSDAHVEDPSFAEVEAAIRALDGHTRTAVSLVRGLARLDVAGDASTPGAPFMVYGCEDLSPRIPAWRALTTPGAPAEPRGTQVEVALAGLTGHFTPHQTTTLDAALAAARTFAETGGFDETQPWFVDRDVEDMRHSALDDLVPD